MIQLTKDYIVDATHYWLFAREYLIWNVAVTVLQFRQQISNLTSSAMPLNEFTQLSSAATQHSNSGACQKKYYLVTL